MPLMASALAGLRSACPAPKVTRSPVPVAVAALVAVSEIGGDDEAAGCATGGGGGTGAMAMLAGGAVGSVAGGGSGCGAGVTVGGGDAVAVCGAVAGVSATCRVECLPDLAAAMRLGDGVGFRAAGRLADDLAPVTASSACRSTVTCACVGPAAQRSAVSKRQACRMRVRLTGNGPGRQGLKLSTFSGARMAACD